VSYELGENRYGKSRIRLVTVRRHGDLHDLRDLTVDVALEGDFEAAHTAGDNANVVATDTMKNTVYAFATEHLNGAIEPFARRLATHFVEQEAVERATVSIREHAWEPLQTASGPAPDAFRRSGGMTRTAVAAADADGAVVDGGVEDLVVMKTGRSAFSGFPRDAYTTLPEVRDRIMATKISASWRHSTEPGDWDGRQAGLVRTLLATFADHDSESVQHSIWLIANAMLEAEPGIEHVTMRLPNLHHWIVDMTSFGQASGDIFVATEQPYGLIDATVRRASS
jgi:urate oxidase